MVSFDSFDEMHKFAREVDEGIKRLEEKIRNPEQLRYGDRKSNEKAHLCLDTLEEEILNFQTEVGKLLQREQEELQLLEEERDDFYQFIKDIEAGRDDLKSIMSPYGYKHRQPEESTSLSLSSSLQPDCTLLENMSAVLGHTGNSSDTGDHCMYTSQNSDELGNYSTPDLFKRPEHVNTNNGMPVFNCTLQDYSASFPDSGNMKMKKEDYIKTLKPNHTLLSQTFVYTPAKSGLSNLSHINTTCNDKMKLRNDIKTPKTNKSIYKSVQITTPPDPGFSSISQQVYRLNMGRYKQKQEENEIMKN